MLLHISTKACFQFKPALCNVHSVHLQCSQRPSAFLPVSLIPAQRLLRTNTKAGSQLAPVLCKVTIRHDWPVLQQGLVLKDLPGVKDAERARGNVVTGCVWVQGRGGCRAGVCACSDRLCVGAGQRCVHAVTGCVGVQGRGVCMP